jgi:lysylphosphatidylglycerol synthetase-like protein (DUF2156 family)
MRHARSRRKACVFVAVGEQFRRSTREAPNGASELMVLEGLRMFREESTAMATFGLSPRIDACGAENLSRANALLVGIGVRLATRLGRLNNLYHYRKKFHTGIAEPSYLLKYPAGIGARDLLGILRAFHVL